MHEKYKHDEQYKNKIKFLNVHENVNIVIQISFQQMFI